MYIRTSCRQRDRDTRRVEHAAKVYIFGPKSISLRAAGGEKKVNGSHGGQASIVLGRRPPCFGLV